MATPASNEKCFRMAIACHSKRSTLAGGLISKFCFDIEFEPRPIMASLNYLRCGFFACALVTLAFPLNVAAQPAALASSAGAQAKTITGRVSNAATGARLEGARVELQGTGRVVTTDEE